MSGSAEWALVVAAGPSLRREDLDRLRGHFVRTYAVNCAVFYAPWADVLFAADAGWWRYYGPKTAWFKGHRVSRSYKSKTIERWRGRWPRTGGNSGHMCIQYAVDQGAKNIAIYAFDQQLTGGRAHVHADHPKEANGQPTNMANAGGIAAWPRLMSATAVDLNNRGVRVVNLSRATALRCFPRLSVEQFLEQMNG